MWQHSPGNSGWYQSLLTCLLFLLVVQASLTVICNRNSSPDLFLAFAAGSKILALGPAAPDIWSFTVPGKVWVDQSWLSHLTLAVAEQSFGPAGPVASKVLLLSGCLALLFVRCRGLAVPTGVVFFTLFLGTMAAGPFLAIRAENFGIFYFMLFLVTLSEADRNIWLKRLGLPLVVVIWCNSHGSFMLGLGLLAAKVGVVLFRKLVGRSIFSLQPAPWSEVVEWAFVFLACVILAAVANPFGVENLVMPFRQLGTHLVISHSADWLHLLDVRRMGALVRPGSVYAYLFFVLVVLCAGFALLAYRRNPESAGAKECIFACETVGRQKASPSDPATPEESRESDHMVPVPSSLFRTDWMMEGIIVLVTTLLAFRYRRFVLFASFALVPVASVVFSLLADRILTRLRERSGGQQDVLLPSALALISVLVLSSAMTWLVYRTAILPYHPENPFRPGNRTLMRDLMSYDTCSQSLVTFLTTNKINGNVLAGWEISSFLLHEIPGVKVFMDPRDQSFYPENIIRDFFNIMGVSENPGASRTSLLDKYEVATVVMSTYPYDFNLAKELVRSQQWGCVYRDDYSVVLVRTHSTEFREMFAKADFNGLRYPDPSTRIRSEAFQLLLSVGQVPSEQVRKLKEAVLRRPYPDLYGLIVMGLNGSENCFKPETTRYLVSEAVRLNEKNPLYRNGAEEVTRSLVAILRMLEDNAGQCGTPAEHSRFTVTKNSVEQELSALEQYYKAQAF
jgi:hypothetical protein